MGDNDDAHRPLCKRENEELAPAGLEEKLLVARWQLLERGDRARPLDRHEEQLGRGLVDVLDGREQRHRERRWAARLSWGGEAEIKGGAWRFEVQSCQGGLGEVW